MTEETHVRLAKVEQGYVQKVHMMAENVEDTDEYTTVCGMLFSMLTSDITTGPVTCKICLRGTR